MEWIKCSDRLPGRGDFVAFVYDGHNILERVYMDRSTNVWSYQNCLGYDVTVEGVTHWFPRPKPPEEE